MTQTLARSSNLLERLSGVSQAFSINQNQVGLDRSLQSFASQASEPVGVVGLMAGGLASRALKLGSFAALGRILGESGAASLAARAGAAAVSLAGEAAVFAGVNCWGKEGGLQGFGKAWGHSLANLGSLRLMGLASAGQSQILQRALNSSAVVFANQVGAASGLLERPEGGWSQQFASALILDVQASGSRAMLDAALPGLAGLERSLDLAYEVRKSYVAPVPSHSSLTRLASAAALFGAASLHSLEAFAKPLRENLPAASSWQGIWEAASAGSFALAGAALGLLPATVFPVLKGKYKAYAAIPVALGAGLLAARLGLNFSSLRESAGNLAFVGSALAFGAYRELWTHKRVNDRERIHYWQHETPRAEYLRTRPVGRTLEDHRALLQATPVEVDPADGSWSHESISRDPYSGEIARDADGYPKEFVRLVHDAPPKSPGFLNGNYFYNRVFDGPRVTATVEALVSTLNIRKLHGLLKGASPESLKDFLIRKFNISYPERFDWSSIDRFSDFFTRPLVTPPEGLAVAPGQSFHDGVLDVVARGDLLDKGIRIAGKGPVMKKPVRVNGSVQVQEVAEDAVLPLRQILGRAAQRFAGESQTLIATYLSPRHWHQTLSPVWGRIVDIEVIEGYRHTVDPGVRQVREDANFGGRPGSLFQSENARVVVTIDSPDYGPVALICTAAALVSTSRVFRRVGEVVELGELLHEYRWGSHNTLVMRSDKVVLAPNLVPGRQVYVRGTKPEGADGITELFAPRSALR